MRGKRSPVVALPQPPPWPGFFGQRDSLGAAYFAYTNTANLLIADGPERSHDHVALEHACGFLVGIAIEFPLDLIAA